MREGLFLNHRLESLAIPTASLNGIVQGQAFLGPVPQGYCWYVENFAAMTVGSTRQNVAIWAVTVDDGPLGGRAGGFPAWDGQGLTMIFGAAVAQSFANALPTFLGPGHVLHALVGNLGGNGTLNAGDVVTVTNQIAVHQLDPSYMMSREDARQVLRAHEHPTAELNQDAVGAVAV